MRLFPAFNTTTGQWELVQSLLEQEIPTGTVNGSNTEFTLSQTPVGTSSTVVFLDSRPLPATDWTLDVGLKKITFGSAPAVGQCPYAVYLKG